MSKIDELIQEYCPDGVLFKPVESIAELKRGTSITKKSIKEGDIPVIAGGQKPAYYHNQSNRTGETIVVAGSGAYAGFVTFWTIPIFVSDAFTVIPDPDVVSPKYLFYFLKSKQSALHDMQRGGGVPHVYTKDVAPMRIPIPPLEVQKEIVNILDKFTQLEAELSAELSAELEARRRQYEYYIDKLFSFDANSAIKTMPMSDIMSKITDGSHNPPSASADGLYPMISAKNINNGAINLDGARMLSEADFEFENRRTKASNGDLLMTIVGTVGRLAIIRDESKITFQRSVCVMTPKKELVSSDYVKYFLETTSIQKRLSADANGSAQKGLYLNQVKKIIVPIPPLDVQQRIVDALDKFDTLTNDISKGLPAEITARRKQYEYYRTKLLTFKELK